MKTWTTVILSSLALLLVAGCGGASEKKLVGFWVQAYETEQQQSIAEAASQIQGAGSSGVQMSLDLLKDRTFSFVIGGVASSGTWKVEDQSLMLTYTDVNGDVLGDGKTVQLSISDNNKQLRFKSGSNSSDSALFELLDD